jgi:hypothetical protein
MRFLNSDPIKADGANWYAYVGNNPITYVDPGGLKRINSAYIHTTFKKESGYGPRGRGFRWVIDQQIEMTKHSCYE